MMRVYQASGDAGKEENASAPAGGTTQESSVDDLDWTT